ncbi:protein of unknown function [Variovorax sp. HW608]|uniref:DUF1127 domain-containing protein n=1 Tax=Variovorax sp. HW608 TaxID=1034889 RepID=UPI00081F7ED3|nr:DUF1127 domain-containing protein [Variovorax sp. HW608]SCK07354.1 protein of unknown function [Variovorax sp. HW608]
MHSRTSTLLARLLKWLRELHSVRQDHRLPRALSDHELRDLGLNRTEIPGLLSDTEAPWSVPYSRAQRGANARPARRR